MSIEELAKKYFPECIMTGSGFWNFYDTDKLYVFAYSPHYQKVCWKGEYYSVREFERMCKLLVFA